MIEEEIKVSAELSVAESAKQARQVGNAFYELAYRLEEIEDQDG